MKAEADNAMELVVLVMSALQAAECDLIGERIENAGIIAQPPSGKHD